MQGTWVQSLVQEDPTCRGATKPVYHNYWAHVPQLLKPACLEPVLHNKRSHHNEKSVHRSERVALARSNKDPAQPKINKMNKFILKKKV